MAKGERDGLEIWGWWMQTIAFKMDNRQGPTVHHMELDPTFWDKP